MTSEPIETIEIGKTRPRIRWGRIFVWVGLIGLLAMLAMGMLKNQRGPVLIGQNAPDFILTTFDGQEINTQDLAGKVIVVNFWASWCKPCEQEAAELEAAWRAFAPGEQVVFLGVDYVDTEPEAMGYLQKFEITYPNGPDLRTKISQAYRIRGVPETYIIDRQGKLAHVQIGPFVSLAQITGIIQPLLAD